MSCGPGSVRTLTVRMAVKSSLTGGSPRERLRHVDLEDHLECQCEASTGGEGRHATRDREEDVTCNCDEMLMFCSCLGFLAIIASIGVLARYYRHKRSGVEDEKESQIAVQRKQLYQEN